MTVCTATNPVPGEVSGPLEKDNFAINYSHCKDKLLFEYQLILFQIIVIVKSSCHVLPSLDQKFDINSEDNKI